MYATSKFARRPGPHRKQRWDVIKNKFAEFLECTLAWGRIRRRDNMSINEAFKLNWLFGSFNELETLKFGWERWLNIDNL